MTNLVDTAAAALGLELTGTLIDRLRSCYDHVSTRPQAASTGASTPRSVGGGSLLEGAYDEAESSASFADALAAFRGENPPPSRDKGPSLGERLLSKRLVSGCSTPRTIS